MSVRDSENFVQKIFLPTQLLGMLLRVTPFAVLGMCFGFLIVGMITASGNQTVVESGAFHAAKTFENISKLSPRCVSGNFQNSFQEEQCGQAVTDLFLRAQIDLIPWLVCLLVSFFVIFQSRIPLVMMQRAEEKKIAKGDALVAPDFSQTIPSPELKMHPVILLWFGLKQVKVQYAGGGEGWVLVTLSKEIKKNDRLVILDTWNRGKIAWFLAKPYSPHIQIIRGS